MKTFKLFGAMILATLTFVLSAADPASQPVQPIGYFVETVMDAESAESDEPKVNATFTRDGETFKAEAGMPVFPGDIVNTPANGGILVAFVNNNLLQLRADSQATIHGISELSAPEAPQVTVNSGRATATIRVAGDNGFKFNIGETKSPMAKVAAPKPAVVEIIVTNLSGVYTSNVFVTAGSATLTPRSGGVPVDLSANNPTQALLTLNTKTNPPSGTIVPSASNKATIAGLKIGNASDTIIKVGKGGTASITSKITNSDGSISTGKVSTLNGNVTKDSWKTAGPNKFKESWTEAPGKISVSQSYISNGVAVSFKAALTGGTTSKASVKVGKNSYTGKATYDPLTGNITFVSSKSPKDGSTATFTFTQNTPSGPTFSAIVKGGTASGTFTTVAATGAPSANTPDGRAVNQNQPPKSQ